MADVGSRLDLEDLRACITCGVVYHKAYMQEVRTVRSKVGCSLTYYCHAHRVPYDQLTLTSGYTRHYKRDEEGILKEVHPYG